VIAEGPTEVGFLRFLLDKAFGRDPLHYGVRVCDGQGNEATLSLLEALSTAGLLFGGFVDNEGTNMGRWKTLKQKLGNRLHQWPSGCTEESVIFAIPDDRLTDLLKDQDEDWDGMRMRTLADRLGLHDKQWPAIESELEARGVMLRQLITDAATGSTQNAPAGAEKEWKKHARHWFKSESGGRELAEKMVGLGAWEAIEPLVRPLANEILCAVGRQALEKLAL
jgi:putative ATP-dependent endonuclease of OLD family